MDNNSIAHTKWNCTYHIVFIPKYRKKVFYGQMRKDLVEIIRKLCEMKKVELIKGAACVDHVHLYLGIPPKLNISDVVAYIKGKSALMIYDRHPEIKARWGERHLWARGYYVETVGNINEEVINRYISEQEESDKFEK